MNWSRLWKRSASIGWDEMTNREIARTLDRIADLLEIKDENPFKIAAYRKAAKSVYHLDEDLNVYYRHDQIALSQVLAKVSRVLLKNSWKRVAVIITSLCSRIFPKESLNFLGYQG